MSHFNHFDFLAPIFGRWAKPSESLKMKTLVDGSNTGYLLDVGGGTGRSSMGMVGAFLGIIIADSSIGMLHEASKVGLFHLVCCNSEDLPFPPDYFERVIMVDALHHVANYKTTIDELWRTVQPGGRIVIEEPDIHQFSIKVMALIEKVTLMRSHFISPLKIMSAFSNPGKTASIEYKGSTAWVVIDKGVD
jgi:demethylmenaquinone methyltransferase/2-methoxy-6-polyprenyl-1,4-benzoquinol methylase